MKEKILKIINGIFPRKENRVLPKKEKILEILHRDGKAKCREYRYRVLPITEETKDRMSMDHGRTNILEPIRYGRHIGDHLSYKREGASEIEDVISKRFDIYQQHFAIRTTEQIIIIEANHIEIRVDTGGIYRPDIISNDINLEYITIHNYKLRDHKVRGFGMAYKITLETDFVPLCFWIGNKKTSQGFSVDINKARIKSNQLSMRFYA